MKKGAIVTVYYFISSWNAIRYQLLTKWCLNEAGKRLFVASLLTWLLTSSQTCVYTSTRSSGENTSSYGPLRPQLKGA